MEILRVYLPQGGSAVVMLFSFLMLWPYKGPFPCFRLSVMIFSLHLILCYPKNCLDSSETSHLSQQRRIQIFRKSPYARTHTCADIHTLIKLVKKKKKTHSHTHKKKATQAHIRALAAYGRSV